MSTKWLIHVREMSEKFIFFKIRGFCNMSEKKEILQKCQGNFSLMKLGYFSPDVAFLLNYQISYFNIVREI